MISALSPHNTVTPTVEPVGLLTNVGKVCKVFADTIWEYVYQLSKLTKQIVKAVVIKVPEYAARLTRVIASVSILTGVNLLLSFFKALPSEIESFKKQFVLNDAEGAFLSTCGLLATLGDMLDEIGTFVGALSDLGAIPKVAFFGVIGLPLAISLLSYVVLTRTYQLIHNGCFLCSLPKEITAENRAEFEAFIKKHLDDPTASGKARKVNILSRHADPKVCAIFERFHTYDLDAANKALQDVKSIMRRKISTTLISTVMNAALLTALVTSTFFTLNPFVIPVILGVKATASLGTHCYKSHYIDKGLSTL